MSITAGLVLLGIGLVLGAAVGFMIAEHMLMSRHYLIQKKTVPHNLQIALGAGEACFRAHYLRKLKVVKEDK